MVKELILIPPVTNLWLKQRTGDMIQHHTKQSESFQTGIIKYHIWYPIYPSNKKPTINKNWKIHLYPYWCNCYLPFIQHSLIPVRLLELPFCLMVILTNFKSKSRYWYEVAGENPKWSSTYFTTILCIS